MAATTIQDFLIGLGYEVDQAQQRRFQEALVQARAGALALAASLAGVVAAVEKVASSYEKLLYASQRIGASVSKIQDFAYAISQVGGSAQAANSSLEAMGSFLRSSPGAESFLARLGVQTRDASGGIRDTTDMLQDFFKVARTMPYFRAKAYAGVLGIDETTLQAGIRGIGQFSGQLQAMYRAAGISGAAAAKGSAAFMQQLRALGAALQVLRDKVALSLERGVGGDIERLRKMLVDNFGRISAVIVTVSKFVVGLGDVLFRLGGRAAEIVGGLITWFEHLDGNTQGWIKTLGALLVAWRVLSLGFLATPLGQVVALGAAILAVYDDYKTWKEGGKAFIDWAKWKPGVDAFLGAGQDVRNMYAAIGGDLEKLWPKTKPYLSPLLDFWKKDFLAAIVMVEGAVGKFAQAMQALASGHWGEAFKDLKDIGPVLGQAFTSGMNNLSSAAGTENAVSGGELATLGQRALNGWHQFVNGANGTTGQRETQGYNFLTSLGLDPAHASAMLGNAEQESGLDPGARNGSHVGLFQWDKNRVAAIKKQFGIDVGTADYLTQLRAAVLEGTQGMQKGAFGQFLGTAGVAASAGVFNERFEVSGEHVGDRPYQRRLLYAQDIANRMAPQSVVNNNKTGGSPNISNVAHITVNGTGHPDQVAKSVARQQDWVTASLVRNFAPLVQ